MTERKSDRLAMSVQLIQSLNDDLHTADGALDNSSLQVIGFDKAGNLLLCQRDEQGKVDGKYLVDCDSGKVVGRTKPGAIYEVWERFDENVDAGNRSNGGDGNSVTNVDTDGVSASSAAVYDRRTGATVLRNAAGQIVEVIDCYKDKRVFERDAQGSLTQIVITTGDETAIYKRGNAVAGVSNHFWYREPYNPKERSPGFQFQVLDDGTLIQQLSKDKTVVFKVNGAMVEKQAPDKEFLLRKAFVRDK